MLHANLSPANPWTTQRQNCIQQAGSIRGLRNPLGACQGGGQRGEEVDCVGKPVARKQRIKFFLMGPAQRKQFHVSWPFNSLFMRSPSSSWSALRLSELSPRKQLHASSHAACSSSTSTSTSTSRRLKSGQRKEAISVGQQSALKSRQLGSASEHQRVLQITMHLI